MNRRKRSDKGGWWRPRDNVVKKEAEDRRRRVSSLRESFAWHAVKGCYRFIRIEVILLAMGEGCRAKGCEESIGRSDFTPVCTRVSCCTVFLAIPGIISWGLINTCNGRNWLSLGKREDGRVDKKNRREEGKSNFAKIISLFNRNVAGERLGSLFSS